MRLTALLFKVMAASHAASSPARARQIFLAAFLLVFLPLLNACAAQTVTPILLIPLPTSTEETAPSVTPSIPPHTPEAAFTFTPAPSKTATPYENIDFSKVELSFGGFLSHWRYFITFKFPEEVRGEYYALVDENKEYHCEVLPQYPTRLYCNGPLVIVYNWANIELFAQGGEEPLFSGRFFIPLMD